ncbi:MAG: hypothetical protein MJZ99_07140 [Bacteroidales bacterium]|nr:hypothetical protein [Bacteroidales bacterium]
MDDKLFENFTNVISRLSSMEGKLDVFVASQAATTRSLEALAERVAKTEASAKSAHKRLDYFEQERKEEKAFVRWAIGIGVTVSGIISGLIVNFFGR